MWEVKIDYTEEDGKEDCKKIKSFNLDMGISKARICMERLEKAGCKNISFSGKRTE